MKKILITGSAGFIGYHLTKNLIKSGNQIIGIDNYSDYYDTNLKKERIKDIDSKNYFHYCDDITNLEKIDEIFKKTKPEVVINLAGQPGVRYSLKNPFKYIDTNITGFFNIIYLSKKYKVKNFIYASSSSVYGENDIPFNIIDNVNAPKNLYAATKRVNELIAYSSSLDENMMTTGLRFFTVYGTWGRPDMALYTFTRNILLGNPIEVFHNGQHFRDFTNVKDIVNWINIFATKDINHNLELQPKEAISNKNWRIYNLGNSNSVKLIDFIKLIEVSINKKAIINYLPIQEGEIEKTEADISATISDTRYHPKYLIENEIFESVNWYKSYLEKNGY